MAKWSAPCPNARTHTKFISGKSDEKKNHGFSWRKYVIATFYYKSLNIIDSIASHKVLVLGMHLHVFIFTFVVPWLGIWFKQNVFDGDEEKKSITQRTEQLEWLFTLVFCFLFFFLPQKTFHSTEVLWQVIATIWFHSVACVHVWSLCIQFY